MEYLYKAIQIKQTSSDKNLIFFSAPATEIDLWSGIPQKKRFGTGQETAGFQRVENKKRIASLKEFYLDNQNIIQNPILCSLRNIPGSTVTFEPENGSAEDAETIFGKLKINIPDFSTITFNQVFEEVRHYIEDRVPDLKDSEPNSQLVNELKIAATQAGHINSDSDEEDVDPEIINDENGENGDSSAVLFEESHIIDFWNDVAARHEVIKTIDPPFEGEFFLDFDKEALLSYLKPIVLVDGQHRLKGALHAGFEKLNEESIRNEIEERISDGESADDVEKSILQKEVRRLPISLLMSDEPAEQVFQFVVVNQKATPVGRALLGTIVSTTLSNDEMERVADRLKNAGIELEESQAITYLSRFHGSPFYNLVERGLSGDAKDLLQWNVFSTLISIFRDLRGGKLFGFKNDYAQLWRQKYLLNSDVVANYEDEGYENQYDYWKRLDGPWRPIFIAFFSKIRDFFGNTTDPDKPNYWGKPRTSNLFNKISLTILASDFFKFLVERNLPIDSVDSIAKLVDAWLENVNDGYFDKDWKLAGVKKDSTGIRKQWAYVWSEYRMAGGQLPDRRLFSQTRGE